MNGRDLDYIETRLLAPATELSDGIERLRKIGESEVADRLIEALKALTDVCRTERRLLVEREWYGRSSR